MKRLFALLMALLCTAMLLTPALAAPEDEGGDATTATDTAADGDTTGDAAADGAATGDEAAGDPSDSAAAGETGTSDDATLAETSYQSVELQVTVDNSGRAYIQGTLSLNIVGSLQEIAVGFPKEAKSPKIEGYKTSSANQNSLKVLTVGKRQRLYRRADLPDLLFPLQAGFGRGGQPGLHPAPALAPGVPHCGALLLGDLPGDLREHAQL